MLTFEVVSTSASQSWARSLILSCPIPQACTATNRDFIRLKIQSKYICKLTQSKNRSAKLNAGRKLQYTFFVVRMYIFHAQAEYSYISADFRLKLFLTFLDYNVIPTDSRDFSKITNNTTWAVHVFIRRLLTRFGFKKKERNIQGT